MNDPEAVLKAAEDAAAVLDREGIGSVVIGAVALAAYGYVRQTEDIDLGIEVAPSALPDLAASLERAGFLTALREAGGGDPLGGVIDLTGPFGLVQIINFGERFPASIRDALANAEFTVRDDSPLRLVPVPQLVALKLYAGGHKSKADIAELLFRNPAIDREEVRRVCARYRLAGLDEIIEEIS